MVALIPGGARYSATDLNKCGGQVLDAAAATGAVQISRRGQEFVLMRKDHLASLLEAAQDRRPQSLEEMLRDYDAAKIRGLTAGFLNDAPVGKEMI